MTVTPGTAATLTGLVTAGGTPVARAQVFAGGSVATTGADGRYTISDLAPGAVDVWVLAGGYAPAVKRGASGTADVAVISTGSTIPVRVSDGHGGNALGTLVRAVDPATGVVVASGVTAGSDRVAPLGPLPAGTYRLEGGRSHADRRHLGSGEVGRAPRHDAPRRRSRRAAGPGDRPRLPGLHRSVQRAAGAAAQPQGPARLGPDLRRLPGPVPDAPTRSMT